MRAKPLYKDRYPGLVPFDKGQSTIFFGRDQEKKELYYQICLEKLVLLFGKSGLGKSSLLNAGVSPMLESNGYLPIRVRFSSGTQASEEEGSENLLIRDFKLLLREYRYKKNILFNKKEPRLWEYIKSAKFNEFVDVKLNPELAAYINSKSRISSQGKTSADNIPVIPVFIFDQFEQFFQHPVKHQHEFLSQLAEVIHDETPYRILDWITGIEPEERTEEQISWHQQPNVKIVFALRSDKLANMQSMAAFIPTVLRNRYELKALTPMQAAQAITGPAAKTDLGNDYTPPFTFEETTLRKIVNELNKESNEIESSQLQIVCNFIEDKIKAKISGGGNAPLTVDESVINPELDFQVILDNFYETQLAKIEKDSDRELARKLIEDDLVIEGQRDSISRKKLNKVNGIGDSLIEEIINTRLVREESTSRGPTYELSHDTLVGPVVRAKSRRLKLLEEKRKEEEKVLLEQERKKKDAELNERYKQLIAEIQRREEAEAQQKEMARLAAKVKSRGRWIFFILMGVFAFGVYMTFNREKLLGNKKRQLDGIVIDNLNFARHETDSILKYGTDASKDSAKADLLTVIVKADSLSQSNSTDESIQELIDSVYKEDFKKIGVNTEKMTTAEKIEALKRVLPRYHDLRDKSKFRRPTNRVY